MSKFNPVKSLACVLGVAAVTFSSGIVPVSAQQQSGAGQLKFSGWRKTCQENEDRKICNVQFRVVAPDNRNITTLNLIEVTGSAERRVFQVIVPTGRSLPPGIQIQIDGKRATAIPYLHCRPQACTAEVRLDDNLVGVFKKGGQLDVATVNFQGKTNTVPVTLKGFTAAFDGPPQKLESQEDRQNALAEELKKKAEEVRKQQENSDN